MAKNQKLLQETCKLLGNKDRSALKLPDVWLGFKLKDKIMKKMDKTDLFAPELTFDKN